LSWARRKFDGILVLEPRGEEKKKNKRERERDGGWGGGVPEEEEEARLKSGMALTKLPLFPFFLVSSLPNNQLY